MKIGFEAKRATHNFRGLGNYSRGLIEGLTHYLPLHQLFLYTPPFEDPRATEWVSSLSASAHIRKPELWFETLAPELWRRWRIKGDISSDKLDIFHGLSHELPLGIKNLPMKKIVTIHDLIFIRYPEFFPLIDRLVYWQKVKQATTQADLVLAICEQTKNDLQQFLGVPENKIKIHYQSCSPSFYEPRNELEINSIIAKYNISKKFILNVGAFEERKNQLNLLEAFSLITQKLDVDLVLIGNGKSYKQKLIERIKILNLESRVKILEHVSYADLPFFYQKASLFCFPSLFEGFGIPIVEALFSSVPVITSHGSCFPESAGPDSVFIDPRSISEIASALERVLSSENLQTQMKLNGLKYAQRFHRKNSTLALDEIYKDLG